MYEEIKLEKVGSSASATLPQSMLDRHQIEPGAKVFAIDTDAGILITSVDPEIAEAMAIADEITLRYSNALRVLAT